MYVEVLTMKKFVSGFLVGAILFCGLPALAKTDTVQGVYNKIKIAVNGKSISFAKGDEPISVNGRTYVPAKYIAEALGATVNYDSKSSTININSAAKSEAIASDLSTESKIDGFRIFYQDGQEFVSFPDVIRNMPYDKSKTILITSTVNKLDNPKTVNNELIEIESYNIIVRNSKGTFYANKYSSKTITIVENLKVTYIWDKSLSTYSKCITIEDYNTYVKPLFSKAPEQIWQEADK